MLITRLLSTTLVLLLLGVLIVGLPPTASAQEPPPKPGEQAATPTPVPTPEGKGKDVGVEKLPEEGASQGDSSGSGPRQSSCTVTSLGSVSGTVTRSGSWASDCDSVNRSGKYARFYSFSVSEPSDVQIDLESTDSPAVDTYMYLLSGAGTSGSVVESDDDGGSGRNSQIVRQLSAGSYTVEATTFSSAATGNFSLSISASPACRVTLGTINGTETRSDSWASDCESVNRSGKYAQFYTFTVGGTADVQIDLESDGHPRR